jgi:integrase
MIDAGVQIAKVSRWMGHSSISVTERVYDWLLPHTRDQELEVVDAYLESHGG